MINITINAETGQEARGALLELLGLTGAQMPPQSYTPTGKFEYALNTGTEEIKQEVVQETTADAPKTKRRTKAEIEAEKTPIAETAPEESKPEETKPQETAPETTVTKEDLQKKAVELGRVGKKELCRAVLQKHGADSISTADKNPLKVELYATVLDEFNKL